MKTIRQTYHIKATKELVWSALVQPKHINAWGGGPAKMTAKEGAKFSLWGGDIYGTNTKVIDKKKLIQDWHDDNHEAMRVTFTLTEEPKGTKLELLHELILESKVKDLRDGWKNYYLGPLKEYVEGI